MYLQSFDANELCQVLRGSKQGPVTERKQIRSLFRFRRRSFSVSTNVISLIVVAGKTFELNKEQIMSPSTNNVYVENNQMKTPRIEVFLKEVGLKFFTV